MSEFSTPTAALAVVGHALHGEKWQRKLAADLRINERQIRRWMRGDALLDGGGLVFSDTIRLLEQKTDELQSLCETLRAWRDQLLAEAHVYDIAVQLMSIDGMLATLSFHRFCAVMRHNTSAHKLGVTKENYERALQSAWEKVHI